MAVSGAGPNLPALVVKATGTITGRFLDSNGNPLANVAMEICVKPLGLSFLGDTPCAGQPYIVNSRTDADGKFTFNDLPVGYYSIAVNIGDHWARVVEPYTIFGVTQPSLGNRRVLVQPGERVDLGDLTLDK